MFRVLGDVVAPHMGAVQLSGRPSYLSMPIGERAAKWRNILRLAFISTIFHAQYQKAQRARGVSWRVHPE